MPAAALTERRTIHKCRAMPVPNRVPNPGVQGDLRGQVCCKYQQVTDLTGVSDVRVPLTTNQFLEFPLVTRDRKVAIGKSTDK